VIKLEFKHEEPIRRLEILRELFGSAAFGLDLEKRSQLILTYHPEWLQVERSDYNKFWRICAEYARAAVAGETRRAQDLYEALMDAYRPILASRVGVDTGQLVEDIETAGVVGGRAGGPLGEQD
jgi:hypothetical protein